MRSPVSQQSWRICVKGIQGRRYLSNPGQAGVSLYIVSQGRRYLSNLGGFVLKESKVAVISAILEDLC